MLLVSCLYNVSERQTEEVANLNLAVNYFLGLGLSLQDPCGKGQKRRGRLYFHGYEGHVSMNAQTGLITSIRASPGSAHDDHFLPSLIESHLKQGIPVGVVACGPGLRRWREPPIPKR